jgi:predicted tellurium resistance membrane protein TerC
MEMSWVEAIAGMVSLTAMEVVLGIDNLVILTLLTANLPADQRPLARRIGLIAALVTRLALLGLIGLIMALETPWFEVPSVPGLSVEPHPVTGKMCILFLGGLFLVAKGVREIHHKMEGVHDSEGGKPARAPASFAAVIVWIAVIDILFSIDSVITAVGMVQSVPIIVAAMIVTVLVLLLASGPVSRVVERHPTLQMLALSFVILIGAMLVMEGTGRHIDKGYIYFAMGFAVVVEILNLATRGGKKHGHPGGP